MKVVFLLKKNENHTNRRRGLVSKTVALAAKGQRFESSVK